MTYRLASMNPGRIAAANSLIDDKMFQIEQVSTVLIVWNVVTSIAILDPHGEQVQQLMEFGFAGEQHLRHSSCSYMACLVRINAFVDVVGAQSFLE